MAESNELALATTVFADLCALLEKRQIHFEKHEEDLVVTFSGVGEDIPMNFVVVVDAELQLLRIFSRLPFKVPEDKRMDLAIATCVASNGLADGSFDYNIADGSITFRLTASFRESRVGEGLFDYLVGWSAAIVDEYNDKFLLLSKGYISINDFISNM